MKLGVKGKKRGIARKLFFGGLRKKPRATTESTDGVKKKKRRKKKGGRREMGGEEERRGSRVRQNHEGRGPIRRGPSEKKVDPGTPRAPRGRRPFETLGPRTKLTERSYPHH